MAMKVVRTLECEASRTPGPERASSFTVGGLAAQTSGAEQRFQIAHQRRRRRDPQ